MIVRCPQCEREYKFDESKLKYGSLKVQCPKCKKIFAIKGQEEKRPELKEIPTFKPGEIIENRRRLWRVDSQDGKILAATPIDGITSVSQQFYIPFENIKEGKIKPCEKGRACRQW